MSKVRNIRYCGHRFPAELIGHAVWIYFRFPPSFEWSRICWRFAGLPPAT
jgi:hypothetical protein